MSTRLDLALQRHPEHEGGIRLLASRDPSQNLKYLDWGTKMLASGQALAPEIADVLELFHRFNGQFFGNRRERVHPDIHTYRPQDLARLRDNLLKIKRASDKKRRARERLYRIEGAVEAEVIYDSDNLVVRHVQNKQASVHYGLGTKWCIAMLREGYFDDYATTSNAVFFFFERKTPVGDEFDKVALMVPRNGERRDEAVEAYTALDLRVDMMGLAGVYGSRVFDIFRVIYEQSARHPASAMFQVYAGNATQAQLEGAFASIAKGDLSPYETSVALQAICCNDAAPQALLEEVVRRAPELTLAGWKRRGGSRIRRTSQLPKELTRAVMAAVAIHPNVTAEARERLVRSLRKRRVSISTICRTTRHGRVEVTYHTASGKVHGGRFRRRRLLRAPTVEGLRASARRLDRMAARARKRARTLQRKLTAAKKKKKLARARVQAKRARLRARP
jgi:hypothetical protein